MKRIALVLILGALAANAADSTNVAPSQDEHRARIERAIANRDYQAWKAERESWGAKGRAGDVVTPENFETFAKMHEATKAGRTDEAATLRQQLGLGNGSGKGMKHGAMGQGGGMGAKNGTGAGAGQGKGKGRGGQGCKRSN